MKTITLKDAEFRMVRNLVNANYKCNANVARTFTCTVSEKKRYEKTAKQSKQLLKKLDAFGI